MATEVEIQRSGIPGAGSDVLEPLKDAAVAAAATATAAATDAIEAAETLSGAGFVSTPGDNTVRVVDSGDQDLIKVDELGLISFNPGPQVLDAVGTPKSYPYVPAPYLLSQFIGQSLSLGLNDFGSTLSGFSPYPNVLMPNTGVQDATWTSGGAGLTGTTSLASSLGHLDGSINSHGVEPPVIGAANQLARTMRSATIICSNAGRGGFGITGFQKGYNGGDGPYTLMLNQHNTYQSFLGTLPMAIFSNWLQGESDCTDPDTTISSYSLAFLDIYSDYAADTGKSITIFTYQVSSHTNRPPGYNRNVALAQRKLAEDHANISLVCPMYFMQYEDGTHLLSPWYLIVGEYFGKAQDHVLSTGTQFRGTRPKTISRSDKKVTIEYHVPVGQLTYDPETVSDPGNMGIEVFLVSDTTLGSPLPISRVYLFGNTQVVELVSTPSGPVQVAYAMGTTLNGNKAGPQTGARGCLRDQNNVRSEHDPRIFLYNWCEHYLEGEGYGS